MSHYKVNTGYNAIAVFRYHPAHSGQQRTASNILTHIRVVRGVDGFTYLSTNIRLPRLLRAVMKADLCLLIDNDSIIRHIEADSSSTT